MNRPATHAPAELPPRTALGAVYANLLAAYGPQGWWPLLGIAGGNPTKTSSHTGYHPGDYSFPHDEHQRFEIAKAFCIRRLPRTLECYQEFHALLVEHGKRMRG